METDQTPERRRQLPPEILTEMAQLAIIGSDTGVYDASQDEYENPDHVDSVFRSVN